MKHALLARTLASSAADAARLLAHAPTTQKDKALASMSKAILRRKRQILAANAADVRSAEKSSMSAVMLDRLRLDANRLSTMAYAIEAVRELPDPVGEVADSWRRPNGLEIRRVRLPLGVILMIFEARPNVTSDAAALCLKSGNAVLLRGGSEALRTNTALAAALSDGLAAAELPGAAIQLIPDSSRELLTDLLQQAGLIDLCIPRGGQGLMHFVAEHARVPVVPHAEGVCHVFVDSAADLERAIPIVVNSKAQRPSVCNAAECLLVHRSIAREWLPRAGRALSDAGVELRACPTSLAILSRAGLPALAARPGDYGHEFLAKILAVRVVRDLRSALDHIARHGSGHTEAILTRNLDSARTFEREVRASCVIVNASTRFNDGGELGLGAEIGISTGRLHAYGPMGLRELCSRKFVVVGEGQIRS